MRSLRSVAVVVFLLTLVAGCSSSKTPQATPTTATDQAVLGDWHGTLPLPNHELPFGVTFVAGGATVSIPEQGILDKPAAQVTTAQDNVGFTVPDLPGLPTYHGRLDNDTITGTFSQSGHDLPLTLTRGKVPAPPRPQEPKPPFPYKSEDVTFPSGTITVAGTLTLPDSPGPHPAVILISGSGAQDRDEQILGHKPFLLLANTLTKAGYAVLRTDDRGVGGTGGDLAHADYRDLSGDVAAGIDFLRGRPEIDRNRIGLLGHSEGGYLAPLVAERPDSGVAFVIMLAGPAVPGDEVLMEQNRAMLTASGATPEELRKQVEFIGTLTTLVRAGDPEQTRQYLEGHNATLPPEQQASPGAITDYTSPNFGALVTYDPAPALRALRVPVLALYGTKDLQVLAAQNAPAAQANLAGDPDVDVHVVDGVNHLMQPANTGLPSEYAGIETTVDPRVLDYVTGWLTARVPPAH
ncbi:alpha/beta hydrolase family protein [Nocardia sp. NPDC004068]|uniref:alpha/beta hydrolase family protein n=1 Tax=Nocardia sp. NPDC004068 TaxID=3364303 RepID=UPI00369A9F9B